jgi:hypothetical protein
VPEVEGQRPPFKSDNTAALRHGAWSPRRVAPLAEVKLAQLLADPATSEYLTVDESYRPALAALARPEAVIELLATHVAAQGLTAKVMSPRGAWSRCGTGVGDQLFRLGGRASAGRRWWVRLLP